jgi:hypothetical protein
MTDERLLDMDALSEDVLAIALLAILLIMDVDVDFIVLFPVEAHTAAVCVRVTPAGVQMLFAYLRVAAQGAVSGRAQVMQWNAETYLAGRLHCRLW